MGKRLSEIHAGFIAEHGRAYEGLIAPSHPSDFADFSAVLGYYAKNGFLEADASWSLALNKFPYEKLPPENCVKALSLVSDCYTRAFSSRRARAAKAFSDWLAEVPRNKPKVPVETQAKDRVENQADKKPDDKPEKDTPRPSFVSRVCSAVRLRFAAVLGNKSKEQAWDQTEKQPGGKHKDDISDPFFAIRADLAVLLLEAGFHADALAVANQVLAHNFSTDENTPYDLARAKARRVAVDALCKCPEMTPHVRHEFLEHALELSREDPGSTRGLAYWRARIESLLHDDKGRTVVFRSTKENVTQGACTTEPR